MWAMGFWLTDEHSLLTLNFRTRNANSRCGDGGDKSVPEPVHGLDVAWRLRVISQRFADLAHAYSKRAVSYRNLGPDISPEIVPGDQLAGMLDQMPKYAKGLRRQKDGLLSSLEGRVSYVQPKRTEDKYRIFSHFL